jgi:IclR family transcriptional regulator, pca regulon regulatory protein
MNDERQAAGDLDEGLSSRDFVQSLERGLAIIQAFDASHPSLSFSDVARRTGLTRAAVRRFLLTFVELGFMRVDDGKFSLRPKVLSLGYAYLSSLSLPDIALPHLRDLANRTRESASLTVLDDDSIVYVAQVTAARPMAVRIDVGTRFPAYATATGRVLLASAPEQWLAGYLSQVSLLPLTEHTVSTVPDLRDAIDLVRRDGYAHVDQELDASLRALAVPVRDRNGNVVAAMAVSTHTRNPQDTGLLADLLDDLQNTARDIEADLALRTPQPSWLPWQGR